MMATREERWVEEGVRVETFYGTGGVKGYGKVIGYCDAPTVIIQTEDGKQYHWRADLTREPVKPVCPTCGDSKELPVFDMDSQTVMDMVPCPCTSPKETTEA